MFWRENQRFGVKMKAMIKPKKVKGSMMRVLMVKTFESTQVMSQLMAKTHESTPALSQNKSDSF